MKVEFLQPRFEGERFEQHTLPVEVARDLAAYEELVIALARHLYLEAHPGRQRVPKGFEESFSLHLDRVEPGSARPLLAWVTALALGTLPFPPGGDGSEATQTFFQARDLIAECIDASAAGQPLPPRFPRELLDYFNVLGRSLREGESVDLHPDRITGAKLTPERRKRLVLAGQQYYTREVHYTGTVAEVDWEKDTFRLRLTDGAVVIAPLPDFFRERAVNAGGKARSLTQIRCIGQFDAYDHLRKIVETLQLGVSANHALAAQFEKMGTGTDGWLEGTGRAIDPELLAWASDRLLETFPQDLPFPFVCPTPTGSIFLEWTLGDWTVSAELMHVNGNCELQAVNTRTGDAADADHALDSPASFVAVYDFIRRFA